MFARWMLMTVALALLGGCAAVSSPNQPVVTIAIEAHDLPPLHAASEDGFTGFEPDLLNALCDAMKARCRFIAVPFHRILPGLIDGRFDAALPLEWTEERAKVVDYTDPYLRVPYALLKKKGLEVIGTPAGLAGKTIGVARLCPEVETLRNIPDAAAFVTKQFPGAKTKPYDMLAHCEEGGGTSALGLRNWLPTQMHDLNAGIIDAIFGNKFVLHDSVIMEPGGRRYEFTDAVFFDFVPGMRIAVSRAKPGLLRDLNTALKAIQQDGTYDRVRVNYFPFDTSGQT